MTILNIPAATTAAEGKLHPNVVAVLFVTVLTCCCYYGKIPLGVVENFY